MLVSPPNMPPSFIQKVVSLFVFAATVLLPVTPSRAQDLRFSVTLGVAERTAAGLTKLTSDQVAVVDAFVRRDTGRPASTATTSEAAEKPNATFSQRLTENERRTAGLNT